MSICRTKLKMSLLTQTVLIAVLTVGTAWAAEEDGLQVALKLSTSRYPSVQAKLAELKSLGFEINAAEAGRYPSLSLQAQAMADNQTQVVAKIQQPIWTGGRITGGIDLSEKKLDVGRVSLLQVRRQLMEDTAATYANLIGARQRLGAAEINVVEHEKLFGLISRRQVGSIASEADVRLARSRLTQAETQREQLKGAVDKSLSDLSSLTLTPLEGKQPVEEYLLQLPAAEVIIASAENNSPLVQQRLMEVEIARIEASLREADMMPVLSATLESDVIRTGKYDYLPKETKVGLTLSGNVEGVGFAGYGRVRAATAMIEAAKGAVETVRSEAIRRAKALVTERSTYKRVLISNDQLVESSQQTLASFMRQYDVGRKSWVDVLNAQKELADARQSMELTKSSIVEISLRLAVMIGQMDKYAGLLP